MRAEGTHYGTEAIDGLRGLAIAVVVFYHSWLYSWMWPGVESGSFSLSLEPWAATGFLGVDLFFFVSGFCLFFPHALSAVHGRPVQTARDFFSRRFWKIVPSYYLALAAAALVAWPYVHDGGEWLRSLGVHLAFVHEFWWDRYRDANGVFWSLAIEVQFYLVFPLVAWAARRFPFVTFPVLICGAFAYRLWTLHDVGNEPVTRAMPSYVDVFAFGMLAAFAVVWMRERTPRLTRPAWLWTVAAIAAGGTILFLMHDLRLHLDAHLGRETWQVWYRMPLAALTFVLALGSVFGLRAWRRVLANPVAIFLSLISYNLYLWHGFVDLVLYNGHVPAWPANNDPHGDESWKRAFLALALPLALGISTAITYVVERPLLARFVKPQTFAFPWGRLRRSIAADEASVARAEA